MDRRLHLLQGVLCERMNPAGRREGNTARRGGTPAGTLYVLPADQQARLPCLSLHPTPNARVSCLGQAAKGLPPQQRQRRQRHGPLVRRGEGLLILVFEGSGRGPCRGRRKQRRRRRRRRPCPRGVRRWRASCCWRCCCRWRWHCWRGGWAVGGSGCSMQGAARGGGGGGGRGRRSRLEGRGARLLQPCWQRRQRRHAGRNLLPARQQQLRRQDHAAAAAARRHSAVERGCIEGQDTPARVRLQRPARRRLRLPLPHGRRQRRTPQRGDSQAAIWRDRAETCNGTHAPRGHARDA